ncbi:MAG: carbonate dehydratase [Euryarchaeota archaeon]|nr:carbonate dehydratase [Euryarchaeota archaeon]
MLRENPVTSWNKNRINPKVGRTAFVDKTAVIIGDIRIGREVMICPNAVIRADEGFPIIIGEGSNVQDCVIIHALKGTSVKIGKNCSLAHGAVVHGPCEIGDNSFIGFNSVILKLKIGKNCFVSHNSTVIGVEIPDEKFVPPRSLIDSQKE